MKDEAINNLMEKITLKCKMPKHWNEFVENKVKQYHFITKDTKNKNFHCTNCQHDFYDKKLKIGDFTECPKCHNKYYIYSINSNGWSYTDNVILVQKLNKQIIIRVFEIWTFYDKDKRTLDYSTQEYARHLPGIGKFINNHVEFYFTGMQIYHFDMQEYWRSYNGIRLFTHFSTYPFNKKRLIKGTNLEYAPINECMEKYYYINYLDALMIAANESFELLWNMKLYNLSLQAKHFNKKGSFYKRFGVSKDYLEFMQRNDISYRQMMFLKLLKRKDIDLLDKIENWSYRCVKFLNENNLLDEYAKHNRSLNPNTIETLKEIEKYVPLKKLSKYPQALENLYIYIDYLKASKKLGIKLISKNNIFPENLIKAHDEVMEKLDSIESGEKNREIWPVYLKLSKYTYNDEKYIIYPAPSAESMKEEGRHQGNCVGYMYLDSYSNSSTEIYFIRELKAPTKSFITLEYKDGYVTQKELPQHNKNLTDEQNKFIDKWLGFRSFIDQKEKIKSKNKFKLTQYNLTKMAA